MPPMADTTTNTTARKTDTALVLQKNPSHNVLTRIEEAKNSLAELATLYLVAEAAGHSQATLEAKRRDLQRFLSFYPTLSRCKTRKNPLPSAECPARQHHANEGRGRNGVGTRRTLGSLRIDCLSYQRCRPH